MERKGKKKHRLIKKPWNLGFQTHSAASSMPKLSFPTSPRSRFFLSGKDHYLLWPQVLRLLEDRGQISPQGPEDQQAQARSGSVIAHANLSLLTAMPALARAHGGGYADLNESFSSIAPACIMKKVTEKQKGVKCIYFKRV